MPAPTLDAHWATTVTAGCTGAFLAFGADLGGDVDASFDAAVEQAGYDHGFSQLHPSVADIDAGQVHVHTQVPRTLAGAALAAGRSLHETLASGIAWALPICADSAVTRTRARLLTTDVTLTVPALGSVSYVDAALEATLRTLDGSESIPAPAWLESLTVTALRERSKVAVEAFKGATSSRFAVVNTTNGQIVSDNHPTAGAARRAGVDAFKEDLIGSDATLDILKLSGRADRLPLMRLNNTLLTRRFAAKSIWCELKKPEATKTIGWLFYGYVGQAATDDDGSDSVGAGEDTDIDGRAL